MPEYIVVWKNDAKNRRVILHIPTEQYEPQYLGIDGWRTYEEMWGLGYVRFLHFDKASQALTYIRGQE